MLFVFSHFDLFYADVVLHVFLFLRNEAFRFLLLSPPFLFSFVHFVYILGFLVLDFMILDFGSVLGVLGCFGVVLEWVVLGWVVSRWSW